MEMVRDLLAFRNGRLYVLIETRSMIEPVIRRSYFPTGVTERDARSRGLHHYQPVQYDHPLRCYIARVGPMQEPVYVTLLHGDCTGAEFKEVEKIPKPQGGGRRYVYRMGRWITITQAEAQKKGGANARNRA